MQSKGDQMNNLDRVAITLLSFFCLTSCASYYPVEYASTPAGATVICNGRTNWGKAPVLLTIKPELIKDAKKNNGGVFLNDVCIAKWPSGAVQYFNNNIDLNQFPNGVQITATRPVDHPGMELDIAASQQRMNELQLQQMQQMQQPVQQPAPQPKTCYTNVIAGIATTNCY